jgi:hypothetical protein
MKAWLRAEDRAEYITGEYKIVLNRGDAVEMRENNAHELMRKSENTHPEYTWEMVKSPGTGLFVVEGTKKK